MKKIGFTISFFSLIFFCFSMISCKNQPLEKITFRGTALGTFYTIRYYASHNKEEQEKTKHEIDSLLADFNNTASVYVPNSIISKINKNEDVSVNPMFIDIFNTSQKISELSNGAFDITVAPLVDIWGFGTERKKPEKTIIPDSILDFVGYKKVKIIDTKIIKTDPRVQINMNAVAKGYAVDLVAQYFEKRNIMSYIVEIGGEIRVGNPKPDGALWNVAIEKPSHSSTDPQQEGELIYLKNISVASSGSYRQYYEIDGERYSHTIDPYTGYPVKNSLLSSTIITEDCVTADALATACMVLGVEKALELCEKLENTEGYFICDNKKGGWTIHSTTGFKKYLDEKNKF